MVVGLERQQGAHGPLLELRSCRRLLDLNVDADLGVAFDEVGLRGRTLDPVRERAELREVVDDGASDRLRVVYRCDLLCDLS